MLPWVLDRRESRAGSGQRRRNRNAIDELRLSGDVDMDSISFMAHVAVPVVAVVVVISTE